MSSPARKITRFYIINPISDRRVEARFEARENVIVRLEDTGKKFPASARDIGQRGLRLESDTAVEIDTQIQVVFPNAQDNVQCYGRVAWTKYFESTKTYECGVAVDAWHGIVEGENSWKRFKGDQPKHDRRAGPR
jgi:hypothetical protein